MVLALGAGGWFFWGQRVVASRPPKPLAVPTAVATARFADGSSLAIFDVSDAAITTGIFTAPPGYQGGSRGGGHTVSGTDGGEATVDAFECGGVLVGQKWQGGPGSLIVTCRTMDASGHAIEPKRFVWSGQLRESGGVTADSVSWESMLATDGKAAALPWVFVQMSDGAGGWIDGSGPFCAPGDPEHRAVLAFPAWPRSAPEFEFRAVRPGVKPVTWKMRNPVLPVTPEAWTAVTLPQTATGSFGELVFEGVTVAEGHPNAIVPHYDFKITVPGAANNRPDRKAVSCRCFEVRGALGSRSKPCVLQHDGNYFEAFRLPPDEKLLRFFFVIQPTDHFPYQRSDAAIVAVGTLAADGKTVVLDPSFNPGHGWKSAEITPSAATGRGDIRFEYKLEFKWRDAAARSAAEAILKLRAGKLVGFLGDEAFSSGWTVVSSSGGDSSSHAINHSVTGVWEGRAKPGDQFALGFVIPVTHETYVFTVARPGR